ncbi:MAG: acyl-CoA dehydratase activase [Thermodesulfobacteriota bacterium]|nr:acyl-CoA dehydratase activase [Thermodesulfobacteriota bacterium]
MDDDSGNARTVNPVAKPLLGLDIGSVSAALVLLSPAKEILYTDYRFHHGDIVGTVDAMLTGSDIDRTGGLMAVAVTDGTPGRIDADWRCDDRIAVIAAACHFHGTPGAVLHVGGERFGLMRFDKNGRYERLSTNTSCAAGTGSFLDQQAGRLNLSGIAALSEIAAANTGDLPKIASRCAVFAKTDLIHAQQEGYSLAEICDGLCKGLARNIVDTVFKHETPNRPVVFCGGVARNPAVINHISRMTDLKFLLDDMAPLYGAVGAALNYFEENEIVPNGRRDRPVLRDVDEALHYGHPPLALVHSRYPVFSAQDSYDYSAVSQDAENLVEVDVYAPLPPASRTVVYLGIDIGSTSTKAVWMAPDNRVLAGFYTRTAGRPVAALCSLLEAMDDLVHRRDLDFQVIGAGATGSGRKFVGKLAGADMIIDEISAHARAASALNPEVDTIIEIGGQDSKFTTLRNGRVTFSIMNTVCAAGTGSFLEEQAEKLGVSLDAYARQTENVRAPMASDRCTVFMERDINYHLSRGYSVPEVLAAALHAVRENYLSKVALEGGIGKTVCFQGATAKNRSLVAAFEQRLNKPIHVSRYCHLTGALGVALHLADEAVAESTFRGLGLYRRDIPVRSEVCDLCPNHCKVTVAEMADGPVAYGFLCGRDYETRHFVDNDRSGFDLVRTRRKIFKPSVPSPESPRITVGIPEGLYMFEDASMWVDFFHELGMGTVTSSGQDDVLKRGKANVGAEFCAPITAMHGHVDYLLDRAEYIFLPYYLDNREKDGDARRQYCYYSQYIPALIADMAPDDRKRIISPVYRFLYNNFHIRLAVYRAVRQMDERLGFFEIIKAYERARDRYQAEAVRWRHACEQAAAEAGDIAVMFLGRPYTVLDPVMNKNIPRIFGTLGVRGFFQDMFDPGQTDTDAIDPFLEELHWNYAADIIRAAKRVAETPNLYPVLITSFKCSPDSFIRDVFQRLMEGADKPYLILELDGHGSSVGYETRIESATRAFRNHAAEIRSRPAGRPIDSSRINPVHARRMTDKTVILPNWDPITCRLLVANMRNEGVDARLMTETPEAITRSMRLNTGQCLPINAMVQEFVEHVRENDLNPANTLLWMGGSEVPCNIRLYPYKLKQMMAGFGGGMEKAGVYTGNIAFTDLSLSAAMNTYFAYMFGGQLRRMGCRTRPYEKHSGETDRAMETGIRLLEDAFSGMREKEAAVIEIVDLFRKIETVPGRRPKAAIFGDLYVRDNPVFNQDLIRFIEACGGEALTTPYNDYAKMIAPAYFRKWFTEGKYLSLLVNRGLLATMVRREKAYARHFNEILREPTPVYDVPPERILSELGMVPENTGESMDNILKIYYIRRHHPDVSLFVQASPAFCCPSLITEAMARTIETRTGVPVVSITYDGTGGEKNRKLVPYIKYARTGEASVEKGWVESG